MSAAGLRKPAGSPYRFTDRTALPSASTGTSLMRCDLPALPVQQRMKPAMAETPMLAGQLIQALARPRGLLLPWRRLPVERVSAASRQARRWDSPCALDQVRDNRVLAGRPRYFRLNRVACPSLCAAFNAALSRWALARSRFSLAVSACSAFRWRASETSRPPDFTFQRQDALLRDAVPARDLLDRPIGFPRFAPCYATRKIPMICSSVNRRFIQNPPLGRTLQPHDPDSGEQVITLRGGGRGRGSGAGRRKAVASSRGTP